MKTDAKAGRPSDVGLRQPDDGQEPIEQHLYQTLREISALAVDYDPESDDETRTFFRLVQNKIHYAVSGKTAAELIAERADAAKPNMGLTSWKGAKFCEGDVTLAKNYLSEEEATKLNDLIVMFLDYAESQARQRRQLFQRDLRAKLDAFLRLNDHDILNSTGQVTDAFAETLAKDQFALFHRERLAGVEQPGAS